MLYRSTNVTRSGLSKLAQIYMGEPPYEEQEEPKSDSGFSRSMMHGSAAYTLRTNPLMGLMAAALMAKTKTACVTTMAFVREMDRMSEELERG